MAALRSPRLRLLLAGVLLAAAAGVAALAGGPSRGGLVAAFADGGLLGAVAFVALYAVLTVALIPGSALTLAAGAIYGPVAGTLVGIAGAVAGATAAFAIARRTARGPVAQLESERIVRIQQRLREHGLLAIIALRLAPVVPFNVLNYVAGASAIGTRDYILGTTIGIVPGAVAFATLGGSIHDPRSPAFLVASALAVTLTIAGVLLARRRPARAARRASVAHELPRLAWSAAFVLIVAGSLLAAGLYH